MKLIGTLKYWVEVKYHVQSEDYTLKTICGRNLGFDYDIVSKEVLNNAGTGYSLVAIEFAKEEILGKTNICKNCLKVLKNK